MSSASSTTAVPELDDPSSPFLPNTHLVAPRWLSAHLSDVSLLDASWYMPAAARKTRAEFEQRHIPTARFFDIDAESDHSTSLPHMLPPPAQFSNAMASLGVRHDRPVVVYDSAGLFSAARLWWSLRVYGHPRVALLHGGLPRWIAEGGTTESGPSDSSSVPSEEWKLNKNMIRTSDEVMHTVSERSSATLNESALDLIVDARAAPRFLGEAPEPRAGLASGHIPYSRNIPFTAILDAGKYNQFLSPPALRAVFENAAVDVDRTPGTIVASCGSGVTASAVVLSLCAVLGRAPDSVAVYDGSWAEWGAVDGGRPVIKG